MINNVNGEKFDVIVVGAGPAGGQCARELSKKGRKVLIIEKSSGIGRPDFSSGGTPRETFKDFDLPPELGRGSWSKILIAAYNDSKTWDYKETRGSVFDFNKLKKFLVGEAIKNGTDILVGTSAEAPIIEDDFIAGVRYKGAFGEGVARGKVVVDASGPTGVLASQIGLRKEVPCSASIGIELIVENTPEEFKDTLAFYFSDYYVPYGYGWIFPFGQNSLKVGVAVYKAKERGIDEAEYGITDMMKVLKKFIARFPQLKNVQPIDLHGGNIYINAGIKKHSKNGFLAIGDAAMQINPLAGEGIRPALHSGRMAARVIDKALSSSDFSESALKEYDKSWQKYIGPKWRRAFLISEKLYVNLAQNQWKDIMQILSDLSPGELFEVGFNFNFLKVLKFAKVLKIGKLIKEVIE
ncbi:MAG: hypothetical protein A2128_00120 [Candidatus Liptonbacteria bacterium GWC1_60_9]|uniref:Digeranylgeranylglycerophospholipid reductase catalytic domain-containing protein n=2 Tax=Candidatus Liptoniibacteriota TaxID=1817909 RepID=A0A1G2CCW7_9BACT|nr:MAG: hypothetical protein A2128_00120 [Candidatus Liptonbacteria bacterium GWC1_60_9]OGY99214.1 MAG: hypothetical protein A3E09_02715 [Candidatus Liptonbacteria bacterium RIFCSPHIGHO2_12_FULL_60_13]